MQLIEKKDGFEVWQGNRILLTQSPQNPCFYVGRGEETVEMYRGNFQMEDYLTERIPLRRPCGKKLQNRACAAIVFRTGFWWK